MPVNEKIHTVVRAGWETGENTLGYTHPRAIGEEIAGRLHFNVSPQRIERAFQRMDFAPHLYEGAKDTLQSLLTAGDSITIWTQGDPRTQLFKVATSGVAELRNALPKGEKSRFTTHSALDKISSVGSLVDSAIGGGSDLIVIVDDKAGNVKKVQDTLNSQQRERTLPVWINQGRSKGKVPEGYTEESFQEEFPTIADIRDLADIRAKASEHGVGKITWLIDFDHTLANSAQAREEAFGRIADDLSQLDPLGKVPPIDGLRLNGNVRKVEELPTGMSGGVVLKVDTDEGPFVIKHNPAHPEKVLREQEGYKRLAETPLSERILHPLHTSSAEAVHVLPYFEGVQIREGMRTGMISERDTVRIVRELLNIKKEWWRSQDRTRDVSEYISMQRMEWQETVEELAPIMDAVAQQLLVDVGDMWNLPIRHNGREYPSLISAVGKVSDMLKAPPPYTVFAHGDASGANILVEPKTQDWRLIDAEWSGQTDPAEAYVRMVKHVSTTTISPENIPNVRVEEGALHIDLEGEIPRGPSHVQEYGLSIAGGFGASLQDEGFEDRVKGYMAGSYIREIALANRRRKLHLVPFAILEAVKAVS